MIDLTKLTSQPLTQEKVLNLFDSLESPKLSNLHGLFKGTELQTGHPLEGLLDTYRWYGKYFKSPEEVHPLIMEKKNQRLYALDPALIPLRALPKIPSKLIRLGVWVAPILKTTKSRARLQEIYYRGKVSPAMIYDQQPIIDVFRKIDDHTLLGLMDIKDSTTTKKYFFILEKMIKK